jgi:DNA polymerase-3 subunit epsilon
MRQVVLDTETTGLEPEQGHRIIEVGCVELVNRRRSGRSFHQYLNPERDIDSAAEEVHGISRAMLATQPRFAEAAPQLLEFIDGAELVIHNAEFDLAFLRQELRVAGRDPDWLASHCTVLDTLALARRLHPAQRNSLDALCRRYAVDNTGREFHGALLDAQLLADVFLAMTGGQASLLLEAAEGPAATGGGGGAAAARFERGQLALRIVRAGAEEIRAHEAMLDLLDRSCAQQSLWRTLDAAAPAPES